MFLPQTYDPLARNTDLVSPDVIGLVVVLVYRDPQSFGRDRKLHSEEFPRQFDRSFLEVIPEREVPQHLEEGVVIGRHSDILDIGRAETLLARCRTGKGGPAVAPEDLLELDHPRGGEEERWVVRNDR